jgi:hypothetical protein
MMVIVSVVDCVHVLCSLHSQIVSESAWSKSSFHECAVWVLCQLHSTGSNVFLLISGETRNQSERPLSTPICENVSMVNISEIIPTSANDNVPWNCCPVMSSWDRSRETPRLDVCLIAGSCWGNWILKEIRSMEE